MKEAKYMLPLEERLLVFCQKLGQRHNKRQKKKVLNSLALIMQQWGYTTSMQRCSTHALTLNMIALPKQKLQWIVVADVALRDKPWLKTVQQRILDQNFNRKQLIKMLTLRLMVSLILAGLGLFSLSYGVSESIKWAWLAVGVSLLYLAWLIQAGKQAVENAGKNAALLALLECAHKLKGTTTAFCFLDENGNEYADQKLAQLYPDVPVLYLNQLSAQSSLCMLIKGNIVPNQEELRTRWPQLEVINLLHQDNSILRNHTTGLLLSSTSADFCCPWPGSKEDTQVDLNQWAECVEIVEWTMKKGEAK